MRIACLVDDAAGPKVRYEDGRGGWDRAGERWQLSPAEATACAFALAVKKRRPDTWVEVVALAPSAAVPVLEDLLRLGADRATLLSDPAFAAGDALVDSRIVAAYLRGMSFDCILAGTRSADGARSEMPPLLAELLALPQVSDVIRVDTASLAEGAPLVDVDEGRQLATYRVRLPAILALQHHRTQVLPYVRLRDAGTDVSERLQVVDRHQLGLAAAEVGLDGSMTRLLARGLARRPEQLVVRCDDAGIEQVYAFLQRRGLV